MTNLNRLENTSLLAWRDGKAACPVCSDRTDTFSTTGLMHHFRTIHKNVVFNDHLLEEGKSKLRAMAAAETAKHLRNLSDERELVSTPGMVRCPCKLFLSDHRSIFLSRWLHTSDFPLEEVASKLSCFAGMTKKPRSCLLCTWTTRYPFQS